MKKILTIIIAILAIGVQSVSAQYAKIMLQHEGKASLFETTNLQGAIDASVDGDTIYIGEGRYDASAITITKKISIIGQGKKSIIGNVTINLPGDSELSATILYGLSTGNVNLKSSSANLHIDKCIIGNMTIEPVSSTSTKTYKLKDMLIERCKISSRIWLKVNDEYENCIIRNCDIPMFSNSVKDVSFINCTLGSTYASDSDGPFGSISYENDSMFGNYINCIIKRYKRYVTNNTSYSKGKLTIDDSTTFVNCLLPGVPDAGSTTNVYIDSPSYTDEELQAKGYLGTDGTIVGSNGGARPFNLVPSVPSLEDINLDVNYTTKKLNVTVKVKAN